MFILFLFDWLLYVHSESQLVRYPDSPSISLQGQIGLIGNQYPSLRLSTDYACSLDNLISSRMDVATMRIAELGQAVSGVST